MLFNRARPPRTDDWHTHIGASMRHVKDICGPVKSAARSAVCALLVALTGALLWHETVTRPAAQEGYPNRPVRMIVPFPAGGTADVLARIVAEKLAEQWRQPVIIDNRAGAGGNIGAEAVASSPPDGYMLLASPPGPIAINDNLYKKLAFQPSKFEPVIVLGTVPNVLLVKPAFPAKTAAELIDYVKANPGKVSFASQGNGSTSHLSAMLFQKLTGTEMVHVPYRGTAPALQDIMGNHIDLFFDNLGSSLNLHNAGNLRILALGSPQRVPSLPDIPTLAEAGVDAVPIHYLVCRGGPAWHACRDRAGLEPGHWRSAPAARRAGTIRKNGGATPWRLGGGNEKVHRRGA